MFAEIDERFLSDEKELPFVVCTIGKTLTQSAVERPNGFRYHQILWVTDGEGIIETEGQTHCLTAGEGVFLRRGAPHAYRMANERFATGWVCFLGVEALLNRYGLGNEMFFNTPPSLESSVQELEQVCTGNSTILSRSAAGYSWLVDWLEAVFSPRPEQMVRRYLEAHFDEPLTLEKIASYVHMSRYTLCHFYKETRGISVMEQLKQIRLAKARQFLRQNAFSVEEVGRMCGYDSPSYFARLFREAMGCTPREYRAGYNSRYCAPSKVDKSREENITCQDLQHIKICKI